MKATPDENAPKDPAASAKAKALTDTGNAERLVEAHGEDLRYCHAWQKWFYWDGRRWRLDDSGRPMRLSKIIARRIRIEAKAAGDSDIAAKLAKWAQTSESRGKRQAMVELAKCEDGIPIQHDELDNHPWLLNCLDGTLDLKKGKLQPHDRGDKITKLVPFKYDATATCPLWLTFLERIIPDPEVRAFLQRAVGWSLTADVSSQVFFFCYGLGANGKSTFLNVIQKMLGTDFAIQAAPELLLARRDRGHPTDQADLFRVRLAVCTEIGAGRSLDEVTVKQLTGGDPIRARRMREDFWQFFPTHHIWIAGNHKPVVHGTDEAIWRRILLVPFEVTIPPAERDPELLDKLLKEIPGILAWAVEGCLQWRKKGLRPPEPVLLATKAYQDEMDVVGGFFDECCALRRGASTPASAMYASYVNWAGSIGEEAVNQKTFGLRLTDRNHKRVKRRGVYHYLDIELIAPPPPTTVAGDGGARSGPSSGPPTEQEACRDRAVPALAAGSSAGAADGGQQVRGDDGGQSVPSPTFQKPGLPTDAEQRSASSPIVPPSSGRSHARDADLDAADVCCAAALGEPTS